MRKFCLTYDAKPSEKYSDNPDELKSEITRLLIGIATNEVISSTRSTLIFESTSKLEFIDLTIYEYFGIYIFYYLCTISWPPGGVPQEITNRGNQELEDNYREIYENLKNTQYSS